ncbi:unnamed protein product [Phytophthora lilii]|uniref:Unnamed protein product n=1 Tax=Phytophthora lilii TaxID=2077276 RepID=A0A9W6WPK1_9STRA|nr:unnamed protein product [Phytophthora lilii]
MAGPQLRFAALLLLLVAVACSCSVSPVAAVAPDARLLREQVDESVSTTVAIDASSSSASYSGSGSANASATISTEASGTGAKETKHESPTTMSFVGPAIAGVLAIVLIGAVVTFKNRMGK